MKHMNDLITIAEVARRKRVKLGTVYWAVATGRLKGTKCGGTILVRENDAANYKRGKVGRPRKAKK